MRQCEGLGGSAGRRGGGGPRLLGPRHLLGLVLLLWPLVGSGEAAPLPPAGAGERGEAGLGVWLRGGARERRHCGFPRHRPPSPVLRAGLRRSVGKGTAGRWGSLAVGHGSVGGSERYPAVDRSDP